MMLLMLGAMHTMGRTRDGQNRHFLLHCQRRGWMSTFTRPVDDLGRWTGVLENYLADQIEQTEYFFWMGQFTSIFQCARWLPEYARAFLEVGKLDEEFRLEQVTRPAVSTIFQGTSIVAPPLSRALGIGACFVLRELIRRNVISNPLAHAHCYVPHLRVRRLVGWIAEGSAGDAVWGGPRCDGSRDIHRVLLQYLGNSRCHFDQCFDIPLQLIAEDPDLRSELIRQDLPAGAPDAGGDEDAVF